MPQLAHLPVNLAMVELEQRQVFLVLVLLMLVVVEVLEQFKAQLLALAVQVEVAMVGLLAVLLGMEAPEQQIQVAVVVERMELPLVLVAQAS
jgi:hypothetical protein